MPSKSKFNKTVNQYRVGDDWRDNFRNINYTNAEECLRSILTKEEYEKVYNRIGNEISSTSRKRRISYDETIFRIMVFLDSYIEQESVLK